MWGIYASLGDCDLWLYLQGIFICIGTAFITNNYSPPPPRFFVGFFLRLPFLLL